MPRKTRRSTLRRLHKKKSMRKHLRKYYKHGGAESDYEKAYSQFAGGARDDDPSCLTPGQPNNRNNLPYYPYIARGSLNSGFQYGDLLMKQGGKKKYSRRNLKSKSKRGGSCGGQSRDSWFRGAYPVLLV